LELSLPRLRPPFVCLLLNVVSVLSYAWVGDSHKTFYWIVAAIINVALSFEVGAEVSGRTRRAVA
jgi:hypothetical protein